MDPIAHSLVEDFYSQLWWVLGCAALCTAGAILCLLRPRPRNRRRHRLGQRLVASRQLRRLS